MKIKVKLIDFGVSKRARQSSQSEIERKSNQMWTVTGNLYYSAPEIFEGSGYDEKIDMWAIGVVLY